MDVPYRVRKLVSDLINKPMHLILPETTLETLNYRHNSIRLLLLLVSLELEFDVHIQPIKFHTIQDIINHIINFKENNNENTNPF